MAYIDMQDDTPANNRFKLGSAVFACRHCTRRTRDTNGDNGKAELCEDCYEGAMWDNGYCDTDEPTAKAHCLLEAQRHYQQAVNKGGVIGSYSRRVDA